MANRTDAGNYIGIKEVFDIDCECVFRVNMLDNTYREYTSAGGRKLFGVKSEGNDFFNEAAGRIVENAYFKDRDALSYFLSKGNIIKGLEKFSALSIRYRIFRKECMEYIQIRIVETIDEDNEQLIVTIENISAYMKREILMSRGKNVLTAAVRQMYFFSAAYNLTENSYFLINSKCELTRDISLSGVYDELIEKLIKNVFCTENRQEYRVLFSRDNLIRLYRSGKSSFDFQHEYTGGDGCRHWGETIIVFSRDEDDILAVSISKNIDSEHRQMANLQEAQRKKDAFVNTVLENSVGFLEVNLSRNEIIGDVFDCSDTGKKQVIDLSKIRENCSYDDFEVWWAENRLLSDKQGFLEVNSSRNLIEQYTKGKNRADVDICTRSFGGKECNWRQSYYIFKNGESGDVCAFCIISDLSEHIELERSKNLLANVPNGTHLCFLGTPVHLEYASESLCRMLGYEIEEFRNLVGDKYSRVIHEDDRAVFAGFVKKMAETPGSASCEYRMIRKDGTIIYVSDTMESMLGSDDAMHGYSAVTDITEMEMKRRQQKEAIKEAEMRAKLLEGITRALSADFESIYYVSLQDGSFIRYECKDACSTLKIRDTGKDFFKEALRKIPEIVYKEDVPGIIRFIDRKQITEALKSQEILSYIYRRAVEGHPEYYQMRLAAVETGSGRHLAIGVRNINEELLREKAVEEMNDELTRLSVKNSISQMQPHFLYNALGSIREIILENPAYASDTIVDFTNHLRACIKAMSDGELIPFTQEIKNINSYMNIEKMRFGDRLSYKYELENTDFDIVPLSIQPLVENAVRHGIFNREDEHGEIIIRAYRVGGSQIIEVEDNGCGFDVEEEERLIREGKKNFTGIQNIRLRLDKMMEARLNYISRRGEGTRAVVSFACGEVKNEDNNR